jgi:hypothetical protein
MPPLVKKVPDSLLLSKLEGVVLALKYMVSNFQNSQEKQSVGNDGNDGNVRNDGNNGND